MTTQTDPPTRRPEPPPDDPELYGPREPDLSPLTPPPRSRPRTSFRRRLAPLGPMLLALGLMAVLLELIIWTVAGPVVLAVVNIAAAILALVIWRIRRGRRRERQARPTRTPVGPGGAPRARRAFPGAGLIRGAASWLGLGGGGRRGGTPGASRRAMPGPAGSPSGRGPRGGVLGRLFRRPGSSPAGSPGGSGRPGSSAARSRGGSPATGSRGGGGILGRFRRPGSSTGPSSPRGGDPGRTRRRGLFGAFAEGFRRAMPRGKYKPSTEPNTRPSTSGGEPMFKKKPKHVLPPTPTPTGYGSDEPAAPARRPSPRPATRTSGGGGGAAPAGNASAYYRGTAGAGDDRSMFAYGKSLERAPEAFEDFARMLGAWAREGEDDQPVDPAVAEQIRAAQQIVTQLGVDSSDWAPNFRRRESAALSRLDSPARGSRYVEEKRDVGAARREGL